MKIGSIQTNMLSGRVIPAEVAFSKPAAAAPAPALSQPKPPAAVAMSVHTAALAAKDKTIVTMAQQHKDEVEKLTTKFEAALAEAKRVPKPEAWTALEQRVITLDNELRDARAFDIRLTGCSVPIYTARALGASADAYFPGPPADATDKVKWDMYAEVEEKGGKARAEAWRRLHMP